MPPGAGLVPRRPMRSPFYLILLGIALLTLALVVRSGMLASKHPDEPISSAMRAAMAETSPQLTTEDATTIRKDFPTAYTTASGLMYINRAPGTGHRDAEGRRHGHGQLLRAASRRDAVRQLRGSRAPPNVSRSAPAR